ncbi:hypothetical protein V9K67_13690 [Paraflavisolibacter sp. H34]|uniref:hypothetical protein n=1 Tax=Huijunlia imazamoxiresistens TaxID=3127457 RepID=UPI0030184C79
MAGEKHPVEEVKTTLQIDEDLPLHQRGWKIQRAGWIFILLFLLLAAIGLFGNGPISEKKLRSDQVTVTYERFFRYEAEMELKIDRQAGDSATVVSLPGPYLKNFLVDAIIPEPEATTYSGGRIQYRFQGTGPLTVVFYLKPQHYGSFAAQLQVNDQPFSIAHFIYP